MKTEAKNTVFSMGVIPGRLAGTCPVGLQPTDLFRGEGRGPNPETMNTGLGEAVRMDSGLAGCARAPE
jgi:hypothetical protein